MPRFDVSGPGICMKFRPRSNGIGPWTLKKLGNSKNPLFGVTAGVIPQTAFSCRGPGGWVLRQWLNLEIRASAAEHKLS